MQTRLQDRRVAITGAAGGIGREIARAFARAGARVAALDRDEAGLASLAVELGCHTVACDVTADLDPAFDDVARAFGGLDILVSNAGAAAQGAIGDVAEQTLRASFELNFFAHQRAAQSALRLFRNPANGRGGVLLFNISNQSVNAGRDFGPYGIPKAALLALMRQYALDHGHENIRANGVNAGRIRTGLLDDDTIRRRAAARALTVEDYMAGNLLGVEVTAADVAEVFVHLAVMEKVNAAVITIDGGTIATALR